MKKNLNEEVSRIKNIMGKVMNEAFEDNTGEEEFKPIHNDDNMSLGDNEHQTKFEEGDLVHNLNREGQYPWRVLDVYRNLDEYLAANGPGKEIDKFIADNVGNEEVFHKPIYDLKFVGRFPQHHEPNYEMQSEDDMEHWDDQGNGTFLSDEK